MFAIDQANANSRWQCSIWSCKPLREEEGGGTCSIHSDAHVHIIGGEVKWRRVVNRRRDRRPTGRHRFATQHEAR